MFEKYVYAGGLITHRFFKDKIYFDDAGSVYDESGNQVGVIEIDGHLGLECNLWDGHRFYRLLDIYVFLFKGFSLPTEYWNYVEGFAIDGNSKNLTPSNVGYRFKVIPLYHKKWLEFAVIPMYTNYGISLDGCLINFETGKLVTDWYTTPPNPKKNIKGGYKTATSRRDVDNRFTSVRRHRVLSLAYKAYPNNVDKLDVNHIDGVPGSDDLDNLEWASRSQNNYHAVSNGLLGALAVVVKNVYTGEIKTYPSITQAAYATGLKSDESLRVRLAAKFGNVYTGGYQYKMATDTREFPEVENIHLAIREAGNNKSVVARNCQTLEESNYPTIRAAAKATGLELKYLTWFISTNCKKPVSGWQFKKDPAQPWSDFTEKEANRSPVRKIPAIGVNQTTGDVTHFKSINSLAGKLNFPNVKRWIAEGYVVVDKDGTRYRRADQEVDESKVFVRT